MNFKITKASIDNIKTANDFLTKLILDEKKYDNNINENCIVRSFYENFFENDNCIIYFAEVKGSIVGYLYGFVQNNGDAYKDIVTQLDAMYVDEKYRNNGIGNALVKEFKGWSKQIGAKHIELKVCNNNENAIFLYEKNNFESTKTIMKFDIEGE